MRASLSSAIQVILYKKGKNPGGMPEIMDHRVPKGQSLRLRYRLIFHNGSPEQAKIPELFEAYAKDQGNPVSNMPKHPGYPSDYLKKEKQRK